MLVARKTLAGAHLYNMKGAGIVGLIVFSENEDVIDRYVTLDYARSAYGVVLTSDLELQTGETRELRAERDG